MKKIIAGVATALLLLTGCGNTSNTEPSAPTSGSHVEETKQRLADGRTVTCLQDVKLRRGGLSCDWAGAK